MSRKAKDSEQSSPRDSQLPPIAVIGVSALFPGSVDATGFWHDILAGRDLITDVPPSHWLIEDYYDPDPAAPDKTYARRGAFLRPVELDALGWGVPPSNLAATDTSQLLALIVAEKVLEDATAGRLGDIDRSRVSVILGVTSAQELYGTMVSRLQRPVWVKALREAGLPEATVQDACERIAGHYVPWQEACFPGLLGNVVAGRIANRFDLGGTNCVNDAACASSFSALSMAVNELVTGGSDMVITGGVDTMNDILMYMCFSKTPAMSPSGDCRPFSENADGTMLGEGLGMVALKRLPDAERDGDRIYAVLRGIGSSSDGRASSVYAPVPAGQALALRRAYRNAGYGPATVELVEAHGTGTNAGDAAEFSGLCQVFQEAQQEHNGRRWCALGSVKSQIGHTKAAAGAAGLFKVVMALHHKVLPPTIKVTRPNPAFHFEESPFYLNTEARPWVRGNSHPRRASVSSFGFGGSNFHLTLEEYRGHGSCHPRLRTLPAELVVLSAGSGRELVEKARQLAAEAVEEHASLPWLAYRSAGTKRVGRHRLAVVAGSTGELHERLLEAVRHIEESPAQDWSAPRGIHYGFGSRDGELAFLFPGQGSQYLRMGSDLAMTFPDCLAAWDAMADLDCFGETRLHEVVFPQPVFTDEDRAVQQQRLTATEWAQPAIGCTSLAQHALLRRLGITASMAAGHSFGEITALYAAGALTAADLLRIARRRGELMAAAAAEIPGAMTAVARPIEELRRLLAKSSADTGEVVIANHNAPRQVVLSGATAAIAAVERRLAASGSRARRLPVATAFHSSLVSPSCAPFHEMLQGVELAPPSLTVFANTTAAPYPDEAAAMRDLLSRQIASPVRFVEMVEAMYAAGARTFLEVGPGSVLTGLAGQILEGKPHRAVALDRKGRHGVESFLDGLARLYAAGVTVQLAALWKGFTAPADPTERVEPRLGVQISGANYGKLYPPPGGAAELPPPNPAAILNAASTDSVPQVPSSGHDQQPQQAQPAQQEVPVTRSKQPQEPQQPRVGPQAQQTTAGEGSAWLQAFQEIQRQTAEAHAAYQQAMAESHSAFLRTAEASMTALARLLPGDAADTAGSAVVIASSERPPAVQQVPAEPRPVSTTAPTTAPDGVEPVLDAMPAKPEPRRVEPQEAPAPPPDVRVLLLEVVSEKTGYPLEMLSMEMDLEQDLGIDSIKRVEILSAVVERAPQLPEIDADAMIALRTLGQIVDYLEQSLAALATVPGPAAALRPEEVRALLLEVVAEKTGYPQEMLSLEMDLEQDLGIDSIKRVEILSAVVERAPQLPEIDAEVMIELHTLGQIARYLERAIQAVGSVVGKPKPPSEEVIRSILVGVVAEKTGYPQEMLSLGMDLEQDLGIDSIKRVEILSAVVDRAPGLPEIDADALIGLHTLGQIVEHLHSSVNAGAGTGQSASVPPAEQAASVEPEPVPVARTEEQGAPTIERLEVWAVATPASGLVAPGLLGRGGLVVTETDDGLAAALVALLGQRGIDAEVVDEVPEDAGGVVFLGGLSRIGSPEEAIEVNRRAFRAARALAADAGLFVTVQDTGGSFGLDGCSPEQAYLGGLAGLAKTVARERPQTSVKAIDLERGEQSVEEIAEALVRELLGGGPQLEVGLPADGRRLGLQCRPAEVGTGEPPLEEGAVVVVSGGARGVTAACCQALAQRMSPRLVLLGRTRLTEEPDCCRDVRGDAELKRALLEDAKAGGDELTPAELGRQVRQILAGREVSETLERLREAGAEVRYLAVDVCDAEAVAEALAEVRADWGPIQGLIHAAGVIADHRIEDKSEEELEQVLAPKVSGLRALLAATNDDPLRLLCLFSSVAGRYGNAGQSDYAMANEMLNKVAAAEQLRRGNRCLVRSIAWGPWQGGMVTPELQAHFAQQGVPLIPLEEGAAMLVDELCTATTDRSCQQVEVVIGGALQPAVPAGEPLRLEVLVDRFSHPYLADHAIDGVPVVPVVLVVEWFARTAAMLRDDLQLVALRDVKVLRGIKLEQFDDTGYRFVVQARQTGDQDADGLTLELELAGEDGAVHYQAVADLAEHRGSGNGAPPSLHLEEWTRQQIYGGALFHGPQFQMIRSVDGISEQGMAATITGLAELDWSRERFRTDAAAFDGGLQLAVLWTEHMLGGASLPTGITEICTWYEEPPSGQLRCVLRGRSAGNGKAVSDVYLETADGRVVASLSGVETHLLPGRAN